jgi:transposase
MTEVAEGGAGAVVEEVEVSMRARRRRFTAREKLRVLKLADACTEVGELGAMLRREGIYSSSLAGWRRARDAGELSALGPKKRGPKPVVPDPRDKKIAELERTAAKAEARALRAEALVELQKKVSELLGIQLPKNDEVP